jgi:hypothetical protein
MQHRPRLTFILAGTHHLKETTQDYWSTLFHLGLTHEIGPLNYEATVELVRVPVAPVVEYDDLSVDRIWLASRGHPYFTQLICHSVISTMNLEGRTDRVVRIADIRHIIDQIIAESDDQLDYLWNDRTREEHYVLAALAGTSETSEESASRLAVSERLRGAGLGEDAIRQALEQLVTHCLVTCQPVERQIQTKPAEPSSWEPTIIGRDYTYAISFDLFRQWVAQKHPLGSLLH